MCWAGPQLLVVVFVLLSSPLAAQDDGRSKADANQTTLSSVKLGVYLPDTDNQLIYEYKGGYDGFEVAVIRAITMVELSDVEFEIINLPTLADRLTALIEGRVDWVVGVFTVTPERAQLVQFIQPYYYSAGAALYAPGGSIQGVQSWGDLRGKSLTIKRGYYAAEDIESTYGIRLLRIDTFEEAAHVIAAGEALALVDDSIIPHDAQGLFLVQTPEPIFREPYGMAVALNNTLLAEELTEAMDKLIAGGRRSTLVQLEQEMLIDKGVPPNPDIAALVADPGGDTLLNPAADD